MVDKIWHAHILDTRAYRDDCEQVFGRFIDHYPYFGIYGADDYQMLQNSFNQTITLYKRHFGCYPKPDEVVVVAARCGEDHSCHVPESCAYRISGACK